MIEIRDISKSYDKLQVLDKISLDINDGEILSIVGPSGAGKTTLLQIAGTLERPDNGAVSYNGVDVTCLSGAKLSRFRNRNIGFIFQFHQLLPEFTMVENVSMPALIAGESRSKAEHRAAELLDYLGLSERLRHRPAELSGGERQRAAVARALVNRPGVILADEPSGSLDSHNREELHNLFFKLRDEMGQTFVIVTHDASLASGCDRVVNMRDGRISDISINRETNTAS